MLKIVGWRNPTGQAYGSSTAHYEKGPRQPYKTSPTEREARYPKRGRHYRSADPSHLSKLRRYLRSFFCHCWCSTVTNGPDSAFPTDWRDLPDDTFDRKVTIVRFQRMVPQNQHAPGCHWSGGIFTAWLVLLFVIVSLLWIWEAKLTWRRETMKEPKVYIIWRHNLKWCLKGKNPERQTNYLYRSTRVCHNYSYHQLFSKKEGVHANGVPEFLLIE